MATINFVYPYRQGSRSAVALSQLIGGKLIRREGSRFRRSDRKTVINWGSTELPEEVLGCGRVLNRPDLVRNASNKRVFFEACAAAGENSPRIPPWTTEHAVVEQWLGEERPPKVFARTVLAGHSGEGIVKVTNNEELQAIARGTLFTRYIPKRHEFRVHIDGEGRVISLQQKKKRIDLPNDEVDFEVRNAANGFVFARNEIEVPDDVVHQAKLAVAVTGLDFGAVDVIWNQRKEEAYVLEVNTAPGLEGSTVQHYADHLGENYGLR